MKIRFVTTNLGKYREVAAFLEPAGVHLERIDRTYPEVQADTLDEVLKYAAGILAGQVRAPWIIDDSGLFVDALNGFPGVYSSHAFRTIGPRGLLRLLRTADSRAASFETALLLHDGRAPRTFRGVCQGTLACTVRGSGGFGFDPVFFPAGSRRTFGEMSLEDKNRVSHRAQAARALADDLARRHLREP